MKKLIKYLSMSLLLSSALFGQDNQLTQSEMESKWTLLFDGKSLKHWKNFGEEKVNDKWLIKGNAFGIVEDAGDIVTKESYENFELKIDWKISEKGNSGIFFRVDENGARMATNSMEVQILDDKNFRDKKGNQPTDKHLTGSIYDILAAKSGAFKGYDTWNSTHLIVKDTKITVYLNGTLVSDLDLGSKQYKSLFAESKFAKNKNRAKLFAKAKKGPIGLQDHHSEVWFKNAKIRVL